MTYAAVSWSHSSGSTGRKSLPSSYLEHAGHNNRGKEELARFYTSAHEIRKKCDSFWSFLLFCGEQREECLPPASHTPREGRGARTHFLWELQALARIQGLEHTFKSFLHTHMWSTESVDEGLSFSSGGLWSKTMVSVLARQNPLDRMISKRDTKVRLDAGVSGGSAPPNPDLIS